jgi:hypothetical protein
MVLSDLSGGSMLKTIHLLHNDNFVSRGLQGTNRKIDKIFTLYHQELLKKRTTMGTEFYVFHPEVLVKQYRD